MLVLATSARSDASFQSIWPVLVFQAAPTIFTPYKAETMLSGSTRFAMIVAIFLDEEDKEPQPIAPPIAKQNASARTPAPERA
jgi:hypothetical protein